MEGDALLEANATELDTWKCAFLDDFWPSWIGSIDHVEVGVLVEFVGM